MVGLLICENAPKGKTTHCLPFEINVGADHTTPEEFENRGFTLKKASNGFRPQLGTLEEFKNATVTGNFGFVFEENSVGEIT